jgi:ribonuclease HI
VHGRWDLPDIFLQAFPDVAAALTSHTLPFEPMRDQVVWSDTSSGVPTAKDAYGTLSQSLPKLHWGSLIWHKAIQPRKSICTWKILHGKILTDERLQRRGVALPSKCSFCGSAGESWKHLFWSCMVSRMIWRWCFSMFKFPSMQRHSIHHLLSSTFISSISPSVKLLWRITLCNLLWCFWSERNWLRHEGGTFNLIRFMRFFLLSLKESAGMAFVHSSPTSTYPIFNILSISSLRATAPRFIKVTWTPPIPPWVKINTDGSFRDADNAGYGGIVRDAEGAFVHAFASRVRVPSALDAEVLAFLEAIGVARSRNWRHLWIETDSAVVVRYFASPSLVPWRLRIEWLNGMVLARQLQLRVTHIFREGNAVADVLANYGASHEGTHRWDSLPQFLSSAFGRDFVSWPAYRFAC